MPIFGAKAHQNRLGKLRGPGVVRAITAVVYASAQDIAIDAAHSITTGATSGKNHEASLPGEAPNADTSVLDRSIDARVTGPLKAEVTADAPYAAALEFGDEKRNLAERPYMRPAAARGRPLAVKRIQDAVRLVVTRSGT
jgi:hypothetical protein